MPYKTVPLQVSKPALWSKSFIALLITQFMVALNDNLFRWLIIPIGKWAIGWSENPDQVRTIGALAFLVPFLVFTAYAGYCCDRFNRRKVIISCKIAELIIIFFGIWGILTQSVPFMLVVLFCLGAQSAFFSPAKYSALPSVVPEERISEANGYYTLTTMVACVGGQLLGGFLFVATTLMPNSGNPEVGTGGMYHWQIWAGALLFVAVAGLISSFFIPSMKPVDPGARFPLMLMVAILVAVEALQLALCCGSCDIDDVILNLLGTLPAYGLTMAPRVRGLLERVGFYVPEPAVEH